MRTDTVSPALGRPSGAPVMPEAKCVWVKPRCHLALALTLAVVVPLVGGTAVAGSWAWYHYGSQAAAVAFLQGRSLLLVPRPFDLGTVRPNEKRVIEFQAVNLTGEAITVHGVQGYCAHRDGCVSCTDQFPLVVRPRSSRGLTIEYKYNGPPTGAGDPPHNRSLHGDRQLCNRDGGADRSRHGTGRALGAFRGSVVMRGLKPLVAWCCCLAVSGAAVVLLIGTWGLLAYGSPYAIPALARRHVVMVRPGVIALGELEAGHRYEAVFDLINLSSSTVMVNGYQSKCTCLAMADDLPLDIPPSGCRRVSLSITPALSQAGKPLVQSIDLYLSVPSARTSIGVEGTVARLPAPP